jgi:type II secretory ATPase GspE/PulE/Tfp pilus assembly ATPase PilB-like protein/CheY-like chemotaxis protein
MPEGERRHWILGVAERAALGAAADLDLPRSTPAPAAWAAVAAAAGISQNELAGHVAAHFRLAVANLGTAENRALRLVPDAFARRHFVLPLRDTDRDLVVATCDPTDLEAEQGLGFASGRATVFEVAAPEGLAAAIDRHYSPNRVVASLLEGLTDKGDDLVRLVEEDQTEEVAMEDVEAEPVVRLTSLVLRDAVVQRASDIHFEPGRDGGRIRFRVDGVMRKHMQLPMPALNRVMSRIKIMGRLDIADRLRPQDGKARIVVEDREYDLRISTVPTREAEKAVIRVLDTGGGKVLTDVSMADHELGRFRQLLGNRDGIIVVTGPTGSGKTTTLYAALREISTEEVNIMTVEDPIEYELAGVTQIQVEPKRGVTFASALRAILRQDPDVILVGEIRDLETAEAAVQAAMTGHLVLATLHTNDAVGAIQRLLDLGLERHAIADAVRGVLAQRLVRRLCDACAEPAQDPLPPEEAKLAGRFGVRPTRVAVGCDKCGHSGYRGRVPVAELLVLNEELRELVAEGAPAAAVRDAGRSAGLRLLDEVALGPVEEGITTLAEIARELGDPGPVGERTVEETPHLLLVDDDSVNRTLARTLLIKSGYRVSEAQDGEDALAKLAEGESFALMVLDLDMPKLGGRDVLKRVRGSVATAGLPVVVLTGTHDEEAEIELMDFGADDYIRKPIDPPRFVARVKAALRRAAG